MTRVTRHDTTNAQHAAWHGTAGQAARSTQHAARRSLSGDTRAPTHATDAPTRSTQHTRRRPGIASSFVGSPARIASSFVGPPARIAQRELVRMSPPSAAARSNSTRGSQSSHPALEKNANRAQHVILPICRKPTRQSRRLSNHPVHERRGASTVRHCRPCGGEDHPLPQVKPPLPGPHHCIHKAHPHPARGAPCSHKPRQAHQHLTERQPTPTINTTTNTNTNTNTF